MRLFSSLIMLAMLLFAGPRPVAAADIGFGIHLGNGGGSYGSSRRPWRDDWHSGWRNEWRDPWRSDWHRDWNDGWDQHRGFERRNHLGFEITRPVPSYDRFDHYGRWHDPDPEWNSGFGWDGFTHWYSGEPSFEYRAEPRRPAPLPPAIPRVEEIKPLPRSTPKVVPKPPVPSYEDDDDGEDEDDDATLYYCPAARAYYPAVRECPGGWREETGVKVR